MRPHTGGKITSSDRASQAASPGPKRARQALCRINEEREISGNLLEMNAMAERHFPVRPLRVGYRQVQYRAEP